MKKYFLVLMCLVSGLNIFSNQLSREQIETFNDNFITIYLHGYWSKCDGEFETETGKIVPTYIPLAYFLGFLGFSATKEYNIYADLKAVVFKDVFEVRCV